MNFIEYNYNEQIVVCCNFNPKYSGCLFYRMTGKYFKYYVK